jgi:hypothetical protein
MNAPAAGAEQDRRPDQGEVAADKDRTPEGDVPDEKVLSIRHVRKCPHLMKAPDAVKAPHVTDVESRRGAGRERGEAERGGSRECDDTLAKHGVILPFHRSADAFMQPSRVGLDLTRRHLNPV